ncbi:MAG: outer membrane beta-barrel protein [Hyphomicrobiales bacterium]
MTTQTYAYEVNNKAGFTTGAAIGTSLLPGWRGELEAAYARYAHGSQTYYANESPDNMSGATSLYTLTANVWKDIPIGKYTTYVGGGVGFGLADADGTLDDVAIDGSGLGLALQFGAGIRRAVSEDWAIDFGYRARGVFGATIDGAGDNYHAQGSFLSHMLQVGFTYGNSMFDMPETDELVSQGHYATLFGGAALHEGTGTPYDADTYEMNFDTGFTIGAALGTQISDTMRGELELSYIRSGICGAREYPLEAKCDEDWSGVLQTVNLLANVWKDFDVGMVSPYVGGGLGLALVLPDIDEWADPRVAMAAQIGGGVRYAIKDDLTLDLGYRFKGVFDPLISGHGTQGAEDEHGAFTYYTHAVTGGLTWDF